METLAYIHLALAHEVPTVTDDITSQVTGENPENLTWFNRSKISIRTVVHLLSLTVALSFLGMARQAAAAVQQGDSGLEVTALQQRLKELGYFNTNVTGYFGPVTERAVAKFQQDKGLEVDGVVGTKTQASLGTQSTQASLSEEPESSSISESESSSEPPKSVLQLGDRGKQVSSIQKRLSIAGFSSSDNGVFDRATQEAVEQFQKAKGLKVDGVVGKQTLAALPKENDELQPKAAPKKPTSFFENDSGPLVPFTRKAN
jgi:peptidoglycan hydrolase-like protein with peptidoglycan-binding domain